MDQRVAAGMRLCRVLPAAAQRHVRNIDDFNNERIHDVLITRIAALDHQVCCCDWKLGVPHQRTEKRMSLLVIVRAQTKADDLMGTNRVKNRSYGLDWRCGFRSVRVDSPDDRKDEAQNHAIHSQSVNKSETDVKRSWGNQGAVIQL